MNSKTLTYPMTKSIEKACILIVAILLPILFHAFSIPGTIFLPIYLSILIASYWLNPFAALALAGLIPVANYLLTGMPPIVPLPMLQILILETSSTSKILFPFGSKANGRSKTGFWCWA